MMLQTLSRTVPLHLNLYRGGRSLVARVYTTRHMASQEEKKPIWFGQFEVTDQVFHTTPLCYALVNIKPLLPGHVLVIPFRKVPRLTDLTVEEVTDVFSTVTAVERMLAHTYFSPAGQSSQAAIANDIAKLPAGGKVTDGSFNVALQDGPDSGQSVAHVHVHIMPRLRDNTIGDEIYARLASEDGNVGGHQFDVELRPVAGAELPKIEEAARKPRSAEVMNAEAAFYRNQMIQLGLSSH